MRTLLIDSYDSHVYNLAHLIADAGGAEPVLAHIKDIDSPDAVAGFDNVVVSAGAGSPQHAADRTALLRVVSSGAPVLGVGLREIPGLPAAGPGPRHVRRGLSTLVHDGAELFAGIPGEFSAVCGPPFRLPEPLPDELRVVARRTEDGAAMAVRHRELPQWWAQFHPESVLTEHGARLVENFNALTRRHLGTSGTRSTRPADAAPARPDQLVLDCHVRVLDRRVDRAAAFRELFAAARHACLLDFGDAGADEPRFSVLAGGGPLSELVGQRPGAAPVVEFADDRAAERLDGTTFDRLRAELARRAVLVPDLPCDFVGGYLGWRSAEGEEQWLFADRVVVVDHLTGTTYVACLCADPGSAAARWCDDAAAAIRRLPSERSSRVDRGAGLRFGGAEVTCSGLDRVVHVDADGWVEARAVTSADAVDDGRCQENLAAVEVLRNELGRVCAVGTVSVPELMRADEPAVVSTVRGRLRRGTGSADAVRAALSATAAGRDFVGWFSCTGAAHLEFADRVVQQATTP